MIKSGLEYRVILRQTDDKFRTRVQSYSEANRQ